MSDVFEFMAYYMGRISLFWWCMIVLALIVSAWINFSRKKDGEQSLFCTIARTLFPPYIVALLVLTIFIRLPNNEYSASLVLFNAFREYFKYRTSTLLLLIVYNYLVFIPYGLLLPACGYGRNIITIGPWKTLLFGFLTSLSIEVFQYVSRFGYFELDDIMFNVTGTAIGVLLFVCIRAIIRKSEKKKQLKEN